MPCSCKTILLLYVTILNIDTITVIKTIFYVITGSRAKQAPGSFIFSLVDNENLAPFKAPLKNQNSDGHAIHASPGYGPMFGGGHDLHISDNALANTVSCTNFGSSYQPPSGTSSPTTILAGTYKFSPSEVEVFYLV